MLASLYWEVVDRLQSYLIGVESLDEFEDWLVSRSWDVHRTEDQPAIHLVSEIELRLAEFTSGHWTEEELRKFFLEKVFGAVYREIRTGTLSTTEYPEEVTVRLMGSPTEYIESLMVPA